MKKYLENYDNSNYFLEFTKSITNKETSLKEAFTNSNVQQNILGQSEKYKKHKGYSKVVATLK